MIFSNVGLTFVRNLVSAIGTGTGNTTRFYRGSFIFMNWKICIPHVELFSRNFEGAKLTSNNDVADPVVKM